jgi:hypothetical protein
MITANIPIAAKKPPPSTPLKVNITNNDNIDMNKKI